MASEGTRLAHSAQTFRQAKHPLHIKNRRKGGEGWAGVGVGKRQGKTEEEEGENGEKREEEKKEEEKIPENLLQCLQ